MIPIALSSWSLHTLFLNADHQGLRAATFPHLARETLGARRIEFYEGDYAPNLLDPGFSDLPHANAIARQCRRFGVQVVCLAAVNDLTNHKPEERAADRARILRLVRHCEILGCPVIRINSGRQRLDPERASRLRDEILLLSDALADGPVRLAIENHPHILESEWDIDRLTGLIRGIGRSNVGSCPDVGAMGTGMWERGLTQLAPMAMHVHLKPFVREAKGGPGGTSKTPLQEYASKVREILTANKYQGAVSYEALPTRGMTANLVLSCREGAGGISENVR